MQKKQQQQPADISNASVSTLTRTSKGFILGMMGRAALQVYEIEVQSEELMVGFPPRADWDLLYQG